MAIGPPGKEVEFRVRREDWSKYEILSGKGIVWVRAVLLKLFEVDPAKLPKGVEVPPGTYFGSTQNLVTAFFDESIRNPSKAGPVRAVDMKSGGQDQDIVSIDEPFNEYLIQGQLQRLIRTKTVATSIRSYPGKFNELGDPIIQVDSQVVISPAREARPEELGR
jgi:hypothetical protein